MTVKPNYIPKILIVDDEPFNLEFLEVILKQYGYDIITANNGREGRLLAGTQSPNLILLDIMMPGENGFECAAALRLSPETCEIPIIFLTALDDAQSTTKGYDAGAVDFIVKPFEYKDVLQRIKTHLLIAECERRSLSSTRSALPESCSHEVTTDTGTGNSYLYPPELSDSGTYLYERVNLPGSSEGHLLITSNQPVTHPERENIVADLLAENSGPIFSPSATLRNIGVKLGNHLKTDHKLAGIYIELDRENNLLTIVNAGSLPVIYQQSQKGPILIERQSGKLGSLGLGLPPCKTLPMQRNDRVFMISSGMLTAFKSVGEAVIELSEACELSAGVDLETACQAAGEMLQKGQSMTDGILVAIEA